MAETSDQIQQHIQQTRLDLNENINELQQKVKSTVDLRTQFEKHPFTMMGVAFGAGVVLSSLLPSGNGSHRNRRFASDEAKGSGSDTTRCSAAPDTHSHSLSRRTQAT